MAKVEDYSNSTNIRGKDWIFNCLWAAAGDPKVAKCSISIPVTFIFRNGQPLKALCTDPLSRTVTRLNLENTVYERELGENILLGESNKYLRVFRKILLEYSKQNKFDIFQSKPNEDTKICTVFYTDGEQEDIDIKTFDTLIRNESWRLQLLIVQGFIPPLSVQKGYYYDRSRVRSLIQSDAAVASDKFTKALSVFVEKAYTFSSDTMLESIGSTFKDTKEVKLKVKEMVCSFILDSNNKIQFQVCDSTVVEIAGARQQIEDYLLKEKVSREASAAETVSLELLKLLRHAKRRGLSLYDSFQHFDTYLSGYIDTDMLIDGLARLGIGVTYPVAESLLQLISGIGSGFITMDDYARYLSRAEDIESFEASFENSIPIDESDSNSMKSKSMRNKKTKQPSNSYLPDEIVTEDHLLPIKLSQKSISSLDSDYSSVVLDSKLDESSYRVATAKPPSTAHRRNEGFLSGGQTGTVFGTDPYKPRTSSAVNDPDINSLSSQRKKRALKEIRKAQEVWLKKKESLSDSLTEDPLVSSTTPATGNPPSSSSPPSGAGTGAAKPNNLKPKHPDLNKLDLQGIYIEMQTKHATSQSADNVLHVDNGLVMTYRVMIGAGFKNNKTKEQLPDLRYNSILEVREKNLAEFEGERLQDKSSGDFGYLNAPSSQASSQSVGWNGDSKVNDISELNVDRKVSFTLIATPDLFMTLDTMQSAFEPLLVKYPDARIILTGIPGLPNTHWPKGWVLNSDLHARSLAKLITFLRDKRKLQISPGTPIFLLGFGTSTVFLTRFVSMYLPGINNVFSDVKALLIVNGLIKLTKSFKKTANELRKALISAGSHETNELVCSLHFWDQYLNVNDRDQCMKTFWKSRRELSSDQTDPDHAGSGFTGVLELLRGILLEPETEDDQTLLSMSLPLFVVQATEDVFVNPKNASRFQPSNLPRSRKIATDFDQSLRDGAIHISWLKAGHEVIQERTPYLLALVSKLAQMCGIHPKSQDAWEAKPVEEEELFEITDILELAAKRRKDEEDRRVADETDRFNRMQKEQKDRLANEELQRQRDIEQHLREEEIRIKAEKDEIRKLEEEQKRRELEAKEAALKLEAEKEVERKAAMESEELARERRAIEKEKRTILARERKKREMIASRKAEMEALYERERIDKELRFEYMQRIKMEKEDIRSLRAAEYVTYLELLSQNSSKARKRKEDLVRLKREEALKKVEDRLAIQRAQRLEDRRKKAFEVVKQIEADEFILGGGDPNYTYDLSANERDPISAIMISTQKMVNDLHLTRDKMVETLKRQRLLEEKTTLFRAHCESVKNETSRLRRAVLLIKGNPAVLGANIDPQDEINQLEKNLASKEETYQELKMLRQGREAQLSASNRAVQKVKFLLNNMDKRFFDRLSEIHAMEIEAVSKIKGFKEEKEETIREIDKLRMAVIFVNKRIKLVEDEYKRIKHHKEEFVDTAVWMEGVLQRCVTKELKKFLKEEIKKEKVKLDHDEKQITMLKEKVLDINIRQDKAQRDCDKMSMTSRIYTRVYNEIKAQPVAQLLDELNKKLDSADKLENKRQLDKNEDKKNSIAGAVTLVDKVRMKDSEIRTKDERKFVGMDIIMNPPLYMHLNVAEIEEMQFDPDYQCELSKADLERIVKLPDQVNLALPFLHTANEIECHRILNKFLKELDENVFIHRDYISDGTTTDSDSQGVTPKDLVNAEVVHDILVREARRDRIRAKGEGDEFLEEEKEWVSIDKVLSPFVYDIQEIAADIIPRVDPDSLVNSIVPRPIKGILEPGEHSKQMHQNHSPTKASEAAMEYPITVPKLPVNRDGDMYQEIRWRYENGEIIFDDSWICPFDRNKLLIIMHTQIDLLETEDEKKTKLLLDKFYVSEDESTLGKERLDSCLKLSKEILEVVKRIDYDNPIYQKKSPKKVEEIQVEEDVRKISRVWGGWDTVHPASAGHESQISLFMVSSFSATRDHPASYAIYEDSGSTLLSNKGKHALASASSSAQSQGKANVSGEDLSSMGRKALTSLPSGANTTAAVPDSFQNDPNSKYFIVDSISELVLKEARKLQGKIILITKEEQITVSEVKETFLGSRQSKSHRFDLPDREDARILDITVSILFQGSFTQKGYGLGRLAAALFRLPEENDPNASPVPSPVGFSPYIMQSPNLPDSMGRIVIMHRPHSRPMAPKAYQIVVGAAAPTKYSITVTCRVAQAALPLVDDAITKARQWQSRLPTCLLELTTISESLQIAERKLLVCDKMILEAELEAKKSQNSIFAINKRLAEDDEFTTMLEDERKDLVNELGIVEVEYAQWSNTYTSRFKEKDDIKEGINMMHRFQRERQHEKNNIKKNLEVARRELPACIVILRSVFEAINIAASLNTTLQTVSCPEAAKKDSIPIIYTPAEDIRRMYRKNGWKSLTLEEQQWCIMDQAVNSNKYEWLQEQLDEENNMRIQRGQKPKKLKFSAAVEQFRMSKIEIDHIMTQPFAMLNRHEMIVRKLITRYHDNPEILKRKLAAAAYGFDPHLAERTRAKDPHAYTRDEKEWSSIDKILHPEVWKYYSNYDSANSFQDADKSKSNVKGSDPTNADSKKQSAMDAMGRILNLSPSNNAGLSLADLASSSHLQLTKKANATYEWKCPFNKDTLLKIWRTPRQFLKTDDERNALKHLLKFNGLYSAYMEAVAEREIRGKNAAKIGEHIKWDKFGGIPTNDIDIRCRAVLNEIERARLCKLEWMDTKVLHSNDQRFPTSVLRIMLEEELDTLLREQIMERERSDRVRIRDADDAEDDEEDSGSDDTEYDENGADIQMLKKLEKRAARREKRRLKLKQEDEKQQVHKAKKLVGLKNKSGEALEMAKLQNQLGVMGCLACRATQCKWESNVDTEVCDARLKDLGEEINRVRADKDEQIFISNVALSAQLGGNNKFKRLDLLAELNDETHEIQKRLELDNIDKELHDSYKTRSEYMEVKYLHGYSMMLWTTNARKALDARRSRLIAMTLASDIVNDILDYMLEGWYFGEVESNYSVSGKVPSIKKDGFIRSGQDQLRAAGVAAEKVKKRIEDKKNGIVHSEAVRGTQMEKLVPIEEKSKVDQERKKVARDGNSHEHMLNETETTLRFGLFILALMYFRAMTFLKREQKTWSGEGDEVTNAKSEGKVMTDERMRMLDEDSKAVARKKKVDAVLARCKVGEARRKEREAAERKEAVLRLQAIVRRQKLEVESITVIQKLYRGHLGRKAAKRWAMKRSEIGALYALLNASAIFIQRIYRGYLARVEATETRSQMAQFIALMRAQEAAEDEEQYWDTHPYSRFKKNFKAYVDKNFRKENAHKLMGASRLTAEEEAELSIEEAQPDSEPEAESEEDEDENVNAKKTSKK